MHVELLLRHTGVQEHWGVRSAGQQEARDQHPFILVGGDEGVFPAVAGAVAVLVLGGRIRRNLQRKKELFTIIFLSEENNKFRKK